MRVTFQNRTVHKRTRVTFVRVANDIFGVPLGLSGKAPFLASQKTSAPSSPEFGIEDGLDDLIGTHSLEDFCERLISFESEVIID
ncbi:MAG: hypothetical protein ACD_62C00263G0001 [uncultured bacterium]|nr:MAG: hypothetical protein ACD_62C00263G0001 [uncultured bacterium]